MGHRTDATAVADEQGQEENGEEAVPPTVEEQLLAAQDEAANNKDLYLRALADLENYRKLAQREKEDAIRFANDNLLRNTIPVLDNLERAMEHSNDVEDAAPAGALAEGVGHTVAQFKEVLASHGVEVIEALGETFDPNFHEALAQMPGEADNVVMAVHEKGYKLNGKLLRPARVVVSRLATPQKDG